MQDEPPEADRVHEAEPAPRTENLLPSPGTILLVQRRYPDGVVALWGEGSRRVRFLRLQQAFDQSWQPVLDMTPGKTS